MRIPQELVNLIIDNCTDDEKALMKLSLVSRSWLPQSRTHLFRELCLLPNGPDSYNPHLNVESYINTFMELCSHPWTTIPTAGPRRITLIGYVYRRVVDDDVIEQHRKVFLKLLRWFLIRSPSNPATMVRGVDGKSTHAERLFWNVREVTLHEFPKAALLELRQLLNLRPFPEAVDLRLDISACQNPFSDIVSSFQSLVFLTAFDTAFADIQSAQPPVTFPVTLKHINILTTTQQTLSESLFPILQSCETIESICIPVEIIAPESWFTAFNRFLSESLAVKKGVLKRCWLSLFAPSYHDDAPVPTAWTRLIHFGKIRTWFLEADPEVLVGIAGQKIVFENVESVILVDQSWEIGSQPSIFKHARLLDEILADSRRFPSLRRVEWSVTLDCGIEELPSSGWDEETGTASKGSRIDEEMEATVKEIRKEMNQCDGRGMLAWEFMCRCR